MMIDIYIASKNGRTSETNSLTHESDMDEAFVVVNGKDLNRLEANASDRSRAFERLRISMASTRAWCCGRCKSVYSWKTE